MTRRLKLFLILCVFPVLMGTVQVPEKITLELLLSNRSTGLLTGDHNVTVDLIRTGQANTPQWTQTFPSQTFVGGSTALVLGGTSNPINPTAFAYNDAMFRVTIGTDSVTLPLSSVPYSKKSVVSESTSHISDGVLFSVNSSGNVGIGTANAAAKLDVVGALALGSSTVTTEGVMRWNGSELQIRKSGEWVSLSFDPDAQEESKWNITGAGAVQKQSRNVGILMSAPNHQLAVNGITNLSSTLLVQGNLELDGSLSVGSNYGISSTGNIVARELRMGIDTWVSGDVRAQTAIVGDGSGLSNIGAASFLNGIISTNKIANGAIETAALALAVINNSKMGDGAISSFNILDLTVNSSHIDANSITASKIATATISVDRVDEDVSLLDLISTGTMTTSKFADDSVITSKIPVGAILPYHIADGAIGDSQIADGAIIDGKIASFAVQYHHIAEGAIQSIHFADILSTANGGLGTGNYTANSVPLVGASYWVSGATGAFWDSSNERFGLATNSPAFNLDILASSGPTAIILDQTSSSHLTGFNLKNNLGDYGITNFTDGSLRFTEGLSGSSGLLISTEGRVKIGSFSADGNELLVVDGGINLATSISGTPPNGTIRFEAGEFQGYDSGWSSLEPTGLSFVGVSFGDSLTVGLGLFSVIGGGQSSVIPSDSYHASIGGGLINEIYNNHSVIVGGRSNTINDAFSSIGGGQTHSLSGEYSVIGGGQSNGIAADYAVVLAGDDSIVTGDYSVSAGEDNRVGGLAASILGGENNNTQGNYSTIVGGQDIRMTSINIKNVKGGQDDFGFLADHSVPHGEGFSSIVGGKGHRMAANYSSILGGLSHALSGVGNMVAGGSDHQVSGVFNMVLSGQSHHVTGRGNVVGGGTQHRLDGDNSSILGGKSNVLNGNDSAVSGGSGHILLGDGSAILGGRGTALFGAHSVALGGTSHRMDGDSGFIAGGSTHQLDGSGLSVAGGYANQLSGELLAIGGGIGNAVSGARTSVGGGEMNVANGADVALGGGATNRVYDGSVLVGGLDNYVSGFSVSGGGVSNHISGKLSVNPGGRSNTLQGDSSVAFGRGAHANHSGSFVYSDGFEVDTIRENEFVIAAAHGVRIMNSNKGNGVFLSGDSGGWSNVSDKHKKNIEREVYLSGLLRQLDRLSVSKWAYKASADVTHMGPTSQDFYTAFGLGETNKKINSIDADGVVLAGIQGVYTEFTTVEDQYQAVLADLARKKAKLKALRARMAKQDAQFVAFRARVETEEAEAAEMKREHIARLHQFDLLLKDAQAMLE